jgi:hypothetical protein
VRIALDIFSVPVSVVLAVQANTNVREYLSFIVRAGTVIESLMLGESGEGAVIAYRDDVAVVKPFETGEVQSALSKISATGRDAARCGMARLVARKAATSGASPLSDLHRAANGHR